MVWTEIAFFTVSMIFHFDYFSSLHQARNLFFTNTSLKISPQHISKTFGVRPDFNRLKFQASKKQSVLTQKSKLTIYKGK